MDAPRAESCLCDSESGALGAEEVRDRDAYVVEFDFWMSGSVVFPPAGTGLTRQ